MTASFTFRVPAPEGECFADGAFKGAVGKTITVTTAARSMEGTVVQADVAGGGGYLDVTVELPDDIAG